MKKIITSCLLLLTGLTAMAQNEPNDCVNAITVCGNDTFVSNANGIGNVQEVTGCGGFENNSIWIKINIAQAGTLGFDLIPDNTDIGVDYDFWVYPANATCGALGAPIRCCTTNPQMAGLSNNHTGMYGSTLITQSGPGAEGNGYVRWLTVSPGQSYYIVIDRPLGDGGFQLNWTGTATAGTGAFPAPPTANQLEEVRTCSIGGNTGIFDLGTLKPQINADTTNNTIQFFATAANAVDGTSPLGDIISNTTNPQQIFAKVTDNTTGCYSLTDFNIAVYPVPNVTVSANPQDACPGADVTVTFSGPANANFNYNVNGGPSQLQTLNSTGTYTITQSYLADTTYTLEDANITTSDDTVVCSQTLTGSVTITINEMDELLFTTNSPLCAGENGIITLTGPANGSVDYTVGTNPTVQVVDLDATGAGTINLPALTATTDFEIISVTDGAAPFCVLTLNEAGTITVTPTPVITNPEPMDECADGITGLGTFDLDINNAVISGGNNYVITYHLTQADADNDTGALASPYESPAANQTVFVRAEDANNANCTAFTTLDLITTSAPAINMPAPIVVCDDNADGFMQFDLTSVTNQITGGNTNYSVSFYTSSTQAEAGTTPIANPTTYTNSAAGGQTIYARVIDTANSTCYSITSFEITVNDTPQAPQVISNYSLCDFDSDQQETFDLTTRAAEIGPYTLTYHLSMTDASNPAGGQNPIADPVNFVSAGEPVYVRSQNPNGCFAVTTFNTVVNTLPVINNPAPVYTACEEVSGQADFILPNHDGNVTGFQAGFSITYFDSQSAAEIGDPTTALPDVYVSPTTDIFARVTSATTGCWIVVTVPLQVIQAPVAQNPAPLEECDFNADGSAIFNLQAVLDAIEAQIPNSTATIHETIDDAEFGTNAITDTAAYNYITVNNPSGILYIRVQSGQTTCYDVVELQLIVHPVPVATEPAPYALCDNGPDDTDGEGIFVLPSRESEILGGLDPSLYTVGYFATFEDAEANTPAITNPGSYTASTALGNTTVYVRVTNNATGCYDIVALELIINPLPVATQPTPYTLCDVNTIGGQPDEVEEFDLTTKIPEIIGLQTGINVTFHHTLADADANVNEIQNPESYSNQSNAEAIYVRVTFEATGCYRIVLLDVRVEPLPVIVPPSQEDLTVCDPDSDGQAQFNLDALVADMINNGENLSVTFHETAQDAEEGINAIPNTDNYTNPNAYNQVIYVRVENTVTGCYTATAYALNLIVVDTPQIDADLADITLCDTDNNDQDGIMAVDLTAQDAYILEHLGNADPSDYIIHYFNDPVDAQNGAPRITNPTAYGAQDGEVIYVRIEDVATGCYSIETFTVYVNIPLALTRPPVLSVCNEALPNDMTAEFDLTVMENTILGPFGVGLGYTVNYYEPGATTPIADPAHYVNTSNPMTLTVEVITLAGCSSTTTMTIKVLPLPTPNTSPDALVLCDDNNAGDGQEEFDLTLAAGDIMDNEPNLILSYHLTYEDADQDTNAIADPAHFVSGTATVYVRVEANTGNPNDAVCYQIVELDLIVNPLPALGDNGAVPAYAICEQNTDGFATFILSSHIPEILGADADPDDYLVRFYFDQAALDAGTALPNQYNNISTPQDILVWVQHIESGCTTTAPMQLLVEEAAVANAPADPVLSTCDDDGDNDGMHAFDLSVFDAEILGTQDPADYSVAYYESFEDADTATNPIADPALYVNTTADVMTIYARVTNTSTISGCHDITEITLIVERLPEPVITSVDGSNTICVDYITKAVLRTVTLDSGIPAGMGYSFVWYLDGVELTGYDPASPTYEASVEGNYTVEVTGPAPLNCISDISAAFEVLQSGPASPVGPGYEVTNYFSDNQVITVYVEGYGEYEYKLDEDGMWQTSNVFTNVPAGTHTVYVRDVSTEFACDEIAIEGVSLVDYPHYFTPNGDGYHDTWNIIGLNQPDAKVYIFDRYGKLIKQISATEESEGWDGTYNGSPLPATDYWFTVTYHETVNGLPVVKEFKAHFSLKR